MADGLRVLPTVLYLSQALLLSCACKNATASTTHSTPRVRSRQSELTLSPSLSLSLSLSRSIFHLSVRLFISVLPLRAHVSGAAAGRCGAAELLGAAGLCPRVVARGGAAHWAGSPGGRGGQARLALHPLSGA